MYIVLKRYGTWQQAFPVFHNSCRLFVSLATQILAVSFSISTSAITCGVSFSWTTPIIAKFYNNEVGFSLTQSEISWMVAISSLGYMAGSLASRFVSDRYGRRVTLLGSVIPIGIGVVLLLVAQDAWSLCIARFLWGNGTGMIGSVSPVYIAEISDKELRGTFILIVRFMYSFGCLLLMAIGPFVSYQAINYWQSILPLLYFIVCWWIPETPYFLLKEGKLGAARDTLAKLTNIKDDELLEEKLSMLRSDVQKEMTRSSTVKELFTGKHYRKAVIISFGLKVTQLAAGLHAIQQYLGPIIQESQYRLSVSTAMIIFGVVRFAVGILSSQLIDRLGRRPLLIYSFFGSGVFLAIVGAYFFFNKNSSTSDNPYGFVPFVGIIFALVIAMLGFESVVYMVPSELFPINVKSVAMTSISIFGGFVNFLSVKTYQQIKDLGGLSAVFFVFATSSLSGGVFSLFFVPETKCKSLRQIQIELQGDIYKEESEKLRPALENSVKDKNIVCEENGLKTDAKSKAEV